MIFPGNFLSQFRLRSAGVVLLLGAVLLRLPGAAASEKAPGQPDSARETTRAWLASLPAAPAPTLITHGLVARELRRWKVRGANQGVAVDRDHFYGIGNYVVGKYDKRTGERVMEWVGLRGGPVTHLNSGIVQDGFLVLAHSNFPQIPMTSSVEFFDLATVQPVKSVSLGLQHGSLTWAQRRKDSWWACFAHYNGNGGMPGRDNRSTLLGKFDDRWRLLESWVFPPQVIATWAGSSCSGGIWDDEGFLYTTGHDAKQVFILRLPNQGSTLEYVTTIGVPFEGQALAWDPAEKRVVYGITRSTGEVVVAQLPEIPEDLKTRARGRTD